jgi:UDP-N-acetylglucosamine acyltransferase
LNKALTETNTSIHPLALVEEGARLGRGVQVGPFSLIGARVVLGDGCIVQNNVTIQGHTSIGERCEFYPGCVIGAKPQDLKFHGEDTRIEIGDDNVFREQVTAHPGTEGGGGVTRIGNHNLFMAGTHIGHDVIIGDHCILANLCLLAGHVLIEDYATIGGHVGVHHFTTIGKHSMIGGMTKIAADVPPFLTVAGTRSSRQEVRMVNGVGLKRRGFNEEQIRRLRVAFMRLFSRRARASGVPITRAVAELRAETNDENVIYLCDFLSRAFECGRHGRYLESLRTADERRLRIDR